MGKNANFVSHKKSKLKENGGPKLPLAADLVEGEIAINFGKDVETLSIKNDSGDVVTFSSDNYYTEKKLGSGFTGENSANTVTSVIESNEKVTALAFADLDERKLNKSAYKPTYTKAEIDARDLWVSGSGVNSAVLKGGYNEASGTSSVAEGSYTKANGNSSHAEGYRTTASGYYSHAEGNWTTASGNSSHAEGADTRASGSYSHAEGNYAQANGQYSHAEGNYTIANNTSEHASGQYNVSNSASTYFGDSGNTLFSVGNGTWSSVRHNAFEIRQNGDIYITSGGTTSSPAFKLQDYIGSGFSPSSITDVIIENEEIVSSALVDLDERKLDASAYTPSVELWVSGSGVNSVVLKGGNNTARGTSSVAEGSGSKAIGNYSHAEGHATANGNTSHAEGGGQAYGSFSHAEGRGTASGDTSHAEGTGTQANGDYSHAEGYSTSATSHYSHAEGYNTIASASYSHAEGYQTKAFGYTSHTEGSYTTASGNSSHAEGYQTTASGHYSHVEGTGTQANGDSSHAEGVGTIANGNYSHVEGAGTQANNMFEHASGQFNISSSASTTFGDSGNTLFSVGNGTANNARHNAFEIRQNGDIYIVSGNSDIKLQDYLGGSSITVDQVIDSGTSASTDAVSTSAVYGFVTSYTPSITVDQVLDNTTSASTNPVSSKAVYDAVTDNELVWTNAFVALSGTVSAHTANTEIHVTAADKARWDSSSDSLWISGSGVSSVVLKGSNGTASGDYSVAEGYQSSGTGEYSHAEGSYTKASGNYGSHAEGNGTNANGQASHAEGSGTQANGIYSHSEGYSTKANGKYSHTEGSYTTASGQSSHAEGSDTVANNQSEHASGQYNISRRVSTTFGNGGNTLFSVGNGTADNARHNAFEIRQNGDIYITSGNSDIKLQDYIGGSVETVTAITPSNSGSTDPIATKVVAENELTVSNALNDLNTNKADKSDLGGLKLVKVTQAEYDALVTKDPNTLYVIVN